MLPQEGLEFLQLFERRVENIDHFRFDCFDDILSDPVFHVTGILVGK